MLAWSELARLVEAAGRVRLSTHVRPDGDALGSELGMAALLEQKGKSVEILNPSGVPERYRFLDPPGTRFASIDVDPAPDEEPDLWIILDTGTYSQLPGLHDLLRTTTAKKVVIDHHRTQDDLGALSLVDGDSSACGMLVYEAFHELGGVLTADAANALFLAIATDTGWMRHPNSTPEVFAALGDLVRHGADPAALFRAVYERNSPGRMRLLATLLQKIEFAAGSSFAYASISQAEIAAAGAHPMDTEDFITYPMSIAGVDAAVLLIEQRGGASAKASFRSRTGLDCSKLAERFGGGGHRAAAGATLTMPLAEALQTVVAAVLAALPVPAETTPAAGGPAA
ncbi:MAG TPA: bifunctional oligoribonuclease/PAP phosphatase NrnA [Planctomycetia bacterium]|nr:bifunctional oligoribonuclease/PAP phosphatase NrnA [Planctomycetia bacterium]